MWYKQQKVFKCIAKCNDLQLLSDTMQVKHLVALRCYVGKRAKAQYVSETMLMTSAAVPLHSLVKAI